MKLDAIDRRILMALQRDGRLQNVELAKQVGLSPSPCLRRVRLLEEAGDCDFLLRVVAVDLDAYRRFQIEHLTRIKGVQSVKTEIPMQKIKLSTELPL
jgi:Lrp/AsnC family leucine-responsive transcriptional regulator